MKIGQPIPRLPRAGAVWGLETAIVPALGASFAVTQLSRHFVGFGGGYGQTAAVLSALAGAAAVGHLTSHPQDWSRPTLLRWATAGARREAQEVRDAGVKGSLLLARRAGGVAGTLTGAVIGTQVGLAWQDSALALVEHGLRQIPTPLPPLLTALAPWTVRGATVLLAQGMGATLGGWVGQVCGYLSHQVA